MSELSTFSIDLKKLIASNHLIIQSKVDEQLEILNSNNFDAPELAHLVRAQSDLIYAINGAKLFKEEIHNLSISAWKNYDFLQALTKKLLQSRLFLEVNSDYCIYRSFEFTMEAKILDLVSALESVRNSDWIERFETWYFEALFNKFTISELEQIWNQFDAFSEVKLANSSFQKYRAAAVFQNAQERTGDMTKRVRKDGSDWKSLLLAAKDEFKTHFPIVLCDEEFFSSEVANLPYDYLICIDNHDIPQNIFANSHFNSILCLHSSPISTEVRNSASDSKNYKSKKYIRLKPHRISANSGQLDHLPGKISFAKSLTHILSLSAYEKHFYSARDFSIITCLSPFCAKLLELELQEIRIKSLRYTHLESGIVEDVILKEDSNKYFVIQDGFLDPMLDLEWQVSTLRNIGLAGMKILTIDTQSLAKNNHLGILDLIDIPETKKMAAYSASK